MPLGLVIDSGGLIGFLITVAFVGVLCWLLVTYVPMPAPFKTVIYVVCVLVLILAALRLLNIWIY